MFKKLKKLLLADIEIKLHNRSVLLQELQERLANTEAMLAALMEKRPKNKLNQEIADHIRALRKAGYSIPSIAEKYGIGESLVKNVIYDVSWRKKA